MNSYNFHLIFVRKSGKFKERDILWEHPLLFKQ